MGALIILGIGGVAGVLVVGSIIKGHVENLEDPGTRPFAIAFWLFAVLMTWAIIVQPGKSWDAAKEAGVWFWLYAIIACPLICYCLWSGIMQDDD